VASPSNVEETQPQVENPMVQNTAETFIFIGFIPSSSRLLDDLMQFAIRPMEPGPSMHLDHRDCPWTVGVAS